MTNHHPAHSRLSTIELRLQRSPWITLVVPLVVIAAILIAVLVLLSRDESETPSGIGTFSEVMVVQVIDGETIELVGGELVRYLGIDAPSFPAVGAEALCQASAATNFNLQLVNGRTVRLESGPQDRNPDGQLLRYVYVDDHMVNELIVREGYAFVSPAWTDQQHLSVLQAAEQEAKSAGRGVWGQCVPH